MMISGNDYLANISLGPPQSDSLLEGLGPQQPQSYYIADHKGRQTAQQRRVELQDVVFRGRLRLREKRREVREERAACERIDARFVHYLQDAARQGLVPDINTLEPLYAELQLARDNLGSLEYEYDRAEDEFEGVEEELDDAEPSARSPVASSIHESDENSRQSSSTKDTALPSGASLYSASHSQSNSIVETYLSRVGDARIVRERLCSIIQAYTKKSRKNRILESIGINSDSFPFHDRRYAYGPQPLQNAKAAYTEGVKDLVLVQEEAERLRQRAIIAGFKIEEPYWPHLPSSISTEGSITKESRATSMAQTHQSDSAIPYFQRNFRKARARINKWILHGLEGSRIEHARHKSTLRSLQNNSLDDESWARLVADWWKRDEMGVNARTDSWELVSSGDSSSSSASEAKWATLVSSETSKASRALQKFDLKFFSQRKLETIPRQSALSIYKWRGAPYKAHLDLDMLSQYESRSF
ncbi:hypothetical protein MMC13_001664 [Lambiella insularis]|nr:hypothetical protein [Lambiella insularis]